MTAAKWLGQFEASRAIPAEVAYLPAVSYIVVGARITPLSARQQEVLERIAWGMSNREIGEDLGIGEQSVKVHAKALFGKLEARDRANAVALGFCYGLLALPDRGDR